MTRALVALLAVVLGGLPAGAGEATYAMRGSMLPTAVEINGYRVTAAGSEDGWQRVTVTVANDPVGSAAPWRHGPPAAAFEVPEGFELPDALSASLRGRQGAWQVATEVLEWVRTRVRHDEQDGLPQDAGSVLGRRRGRCSGIANLGAALLIAAGLEARTVSGLLISADGSAIPHRWLECRFPDAGWVATDPTLGRWMITPRHVAFPEAVAEMPEIRVLEPDLSRPAPRVNRGAELRCRLVGAPPSDGGVALLHGPDGQLRETALRPGGRFTGLEPGRWVLEVRIAGVLLARRALELDDELPLSLAIPVPEEAGVDS